MTYVHPELPVNLHESNPRQKKLRWFVHTESGSSQIFTSFRSDWGIKIDPADPLNSCFVDYSVEMEFASPLFASIPRQFFDLLAGNVDN